MKQIINKIRKNVILMFFFAGVFFTIVSMRVNAAAPDLNRTGTIKVTLTAASTMEAISDGTVTLYKVAKLETDYSFTYEGGFSGCTYDIKNTPSRELAEKLKVFCNDNNITGVTKQFADDAGTVTYENLETGLYLLVNTKAAEGYYKFVPCLVSMPLQTSVQSDLLYEIDVTPKVTVLPADASDDIPNETPNAEQDTSDNEHEVSEKKEPDMENVSEREQKLPQTGILLWPIYVFFGVGLVLIAIGIVCYCRENYGTRKKKARQEE